MSAILPDGKSHARHNQRTRTDATRQKEWPRKSAKIGGNILFAKLISGGVKETEEAQRLANHLISVTLCFLSRPRRYMETSVMRFQRDIKPMSRRRSKLTSGDIVKKYAKQPVYSLLKENDRRVKN